MSQGLVGGPDSLEGRHKPDFFCLPRNRFSILSAKLGLGFVGLTNERWLRWTIVGSVGYEPSMA